MQSVTGSVSGLAMKGHDQVIPDPGEVLVWSGHWLCITVHIPGMTQPLLGALMCVWMVFCTQHVEANTSSPLEWGQIKKLSVFFRQFLLQHYSGKWKRWVRGFSLSFQGMYFSSSVTSSVSYEILTLIRGWEFPSIEDTPLTFEAGHHILKYSSQADAYVTHKVPCSLYPRAG